MDRIVLSHPLYRDGMALLEGRAELVIPNDGDCGHILDLLRDADAFILRIGRIDGPAIDRCPRLRVITRPGVGYDNVDVEAATRHGIPVVLCPSANARAVAEHTVSLLFACSKNTVESAAETRRGNFSIRDKYAAVDILGKTLVLLGFGAIGREVARLCAGLDMRIGVYDPFVRRETVEALGYTYYGDLPEALAGADYVSLHLPSLPSTRGMISGPQLAAMKPSAFLLNTARGDIVDEAALLAALERGGIAGAGLDVLAQEPIPEDHPLLRLPNVTITPHMAAQTRETVSKLVTMAAQGTLAVLAGQRWPHVANPQAYDHPRWQSQ